MNIEDLINGPPSKRPKLHEQTITPGEQPGPSGSNPSKAPEDPESLTMNGRVYKRRMNLGQGEVDVKIIFPQHTEETYKKLVWNDVSTVIPAHCVLTPGSVPLKHIQELGRGQNGLVDAVEPGDEQLQLPGKVYARKILKLCHNQHGNAMSQELARLQSARALHHQHITAVSMTYEEKTGPHEVSYGILMNPVAKHTLASVLEDASTTDPNRQWLPGVVKRWVGCLASSLSYIHAKELVHGNIAPSNILIENGEPYFTEFAITTHFAHTGNLVKDASTPDPGTEDYKAPELEVQRALGPKADVFSLGCVYVDLLAALVGKPSRDFNGIDPGANSRSNTDRPSKRQAYLADFLHKKLLPVPFFQGFSKLCQPMMLYNPAARPSSFAIANSIFEVHLGLSGGGLDFKLECDCLSPWRTNENEQCRMVMALPMDAQDRASVPPGMYSLPRSTIAEGTTCPHCSQSCRNILELLSHTMSKHPEQRNQMKDFRCQYDTCAGRPSFEDMNQFQDHLVKCHGEGFN